MPWTPLLFFFTPTYFFLLLGRDNISNFKERQEKKKTMTMKKSESKEPKKKEWEKKRDFPFVYKARIHTNISNPSTTKPMTHISIQREVHTHIYIHLL